MKKLLALVMCLCMFAVPAMADTFEGVGTGIGGELKLNVTVEDGKIAASKSTKCVLFASRFADATCAYASPLRKCIESGTMARATSRCSMDSLSSIG